MKRLPVVCPNYTSYESIELVCPTCGQDNIFNRATDLGTFERIDGHDVACLMPDCGEPFRLLGDLVNHPYEMMIWDCERLIQQKRYISCVLTVAQAYETFFSLFLRVQLAYKPAASDPNGNVVHLNRLGSCRVSGWPGRGC
jgi:hypothetical protein